MNILKFYNFDRIYHKAELKEPKKKKFFYPFPLLLAVIFLLSSCKEQKNPVAAVIANQRETVLAIRDGLRNYASSITIRFHTGRYELDDLSSLVDGWVEEALEETTYATEGDYIRSQYGGYTLETYREVEGENYLYTAVLTPAYYGYRSWEKQTTKSIEQIMLNFNFHKNTTEYEKVRVIYDYLCQNTQYDKIHLKNTYNHINSTAYGAIVLHSATCHGFAAALYRMLRTADIDSRVIMGIGIDDNGHEEYHAWNIARIDGKYYSLDATWDAQLLANPDKTEEILSSGYQYFLKSGRNFKNHIPDKKFKNDSFTNFYSLSPADYPIP